MSKTKEFPPPPEQPFVGHLIELRDRLLRAVVAILLVFLALFSFANDLYSILAEPLLRHLPQGTSMIATEVASPFLTPFKLTLVLSVFIAIPYLLYQAWGFIAPALYAKEKRLIFPLLLSSTLLFYTGMAFAYFVVFPLVFGFLTGVVPEGVAVMTDISRYLDFVLKLFFAFGIAFEVPIATILVIWAGLITREELAKKRPYIIVAAFVIGMLLTPPDVISQTLLALPMWLLFELGLIFSRFYRKPASEDDAEDLDTADDEANKNPSPTPQSASVAGSSHDVQHDDSAGSADHYSEAGEETSELSEDDIEREFDRLESEEDNADDGDDTDTTQQHEEFEPIEEERQRLADQKAAAEADKNDSSDNDAEQKPPSKT